MVRPGFNSRAHPSLSALLGVQEEIVMSEQEYKRLLDAIDNLEALALDLISTERTDERETVASVVYDLSEDLADLIRAGVVVVNRLPRVER